MEPFQSEQFRSVSASIPPPVGGWNARDPIDSMDPQDAIRLVNVFPEQRVVKLRKGFRVHSTGMGSGAVQTVCEFVGSDGTRRLVSAANGNIYNASTFDTTATSLGSGFTNNKWQTTMFKDTLILCNGADQPQQYDGTTLSAAAYTGIADDSVLTSVDVYKSRLYFVEKDSTSFWYGGTGSVTGAVTEFDVGDALRLGGFIEFSGSWTRDTGDGLQDLFIIVTDMGEVLTYTGTDPGSNFVLAGRYYIPTPLGRRSFVRLKSDLVILTEDGAVPLSQVITSNDPTKVNTLSDKIVDAFNSASAMYKSNFGWEGLFYPQGKQVLVNVPMAEDTQSVQYVMNIRTGAWCQYKGIDAICWTLFAEKPYFGGIDGKVYEFDTGQDDNDTAIEVDVKFAFNYFDDRTRVKRFLMARPLFLGNSTFSLDFGIDVDFEDNITTATTTVTGSAGSPWDTSPWDSSSWDSGNVVVNDWNAISGIGRCAALKIKTNVQDLTFEMSAIYVTFEPGGIL